MPHFSCPACGADVEFKSVVSLFAVCSHCDSTLLRRFENLETLGTMAELPEDLSVLQIGTRGLYAGNRFELVGRLKLSWSDGNWNEWFAFFDDGTSGWLAEAQGSYMMSFEVAEKLTLPPLAKLSPGANVDLGNGRIFGVTDIKSATCVGSQGELPFSGIAGRKSTSVDLTGPHEEFATLDYAENEPVRAYIGNWVEAEELRLENLRELDGW